MDHSLSDLCRLGGVVRLTAVAPSRQGIAGCHALEHGHDRQYAKLRYSFAQLDANVTLDRLVRKWFDDSAGHNESVMYRRGHGPFSVGLATEHLSVHVYLMF